MTDKHTPGEWIIKYQTNIASRDNGRLVANCGGHQDSHVDQGPENQANAARIVAMNRSYDALLSACKEMHRTLTAPSRQLLDSTRDELNPWLPMIESAIALSEPPQ